MPRNQAAKQVVTTQVVTDATIDFVDINTDNQGQVTATFTVTGTGPVIVFVSRVGGAPLQTTSKNLYCYGIALDLRLPS